MNKDYYDDYADFAVDEYNALESAYENKKKTNDKLTINKLIKENKKLKEDVKLLVKFINFYSPTTNTEDNGHNFLSIVTGCDLTELEGDNNKDWRLIKRFLARAKELGIVISKEEE